MDGFSAPVSTNDKLIRSALRESLESRYKDDSKTKIIEELGLTHGMVRVDLVLVNGVIHGYELKSDLDTLHRLPEQMKVYNEVLDRMTLVVGKSHLHEAIRLIPDWWGVIMAKISENDEVVSLFTIREAEDNHGKSSLAIARLLWKNEALEILDGLERAGGVKSKPREAIYQRLAEVLDQESLCEKVRDRLLNRIGWRFEKLHMLNDD